MAANPSVKQRLLIEIEQLPEKQLTQVLQFVGALQANAQHSNLETSVTPDPLDSFIGTVSHDSLAQDIDVELYSWSLKQQQCCLSDHMHCVVR